MINSLATNRSGSLTGRKNGVDRNSSRILSFGVIATKMEINEIKKMSERAMNKLNDKSPTGAMNANNGNITHNIPTIKQV